jgi:hypothetical protein
MNKQAHRPAALALCLALLLTLLPTPKAQAATANNTDKDHAISVTSGETVTLPTVDRNTYFYYSIQTEKPNQFIQVYFSNSSNSVSFAGFFDDTYNALDWYSASYGTGRVGVAKTNDVGLYYFYAWVESGYSGDTMTVTLLDNDANEPNDTAETAVPLTEGQSTDFIVGGGDTDYFSIQTTRPGQDIAVKVSGFSYAVQGWVYLAVDDENE